jgi:hypothetical protein
MGHLHLLVPEQRGDRLQPHAPVDRLSGQGVPQPVRVHSGDAGDAAHSVDDAADRMPVEWAAVIGDQSPVGANVLEVGRRPVAEQRDELWVQRDVAVVAEFAEWDPQPVVGADLHDGVGFEVGQFAGAHAGAGQQFDDQSIPRVAACAGGGHEFGRVAVVQELR